MEKVSKYNRASFKAQRNKFKALVRSAKSEYFNTYIGSQKGNHRALFKTAGQLTHSKSPQPLPPPSNEQDLLNSFTSFFVQKLIISGKTFLDCGQIKEKDYTRPSTAEFTQFHTLSQDEVAEMIRNGSSKSCSLDPIPTCLLKLCLTDLLPCITNIINMSLHFGKMPQAFKQVVVTPILRKEGADPNFKNFRPISNLPFLSKLVEKVVCKQVSEYIELNSLNEPYQSAYRPCHSTETAVLKVVNDILLKLDNRKIVLLTLLNLSAAFDTVDRKILLDRLSNMYGIQGTALTWFHSYLDNRGQSVVINGVKSNQHTLEYSIPQGSVMGPNLYCKYTKPVAGIISQHFIQYHLYANDSQLYTSLSPDIDNQSEIVSNLENCIADISKWMSMNKLKLKQDKTEFLLFGNSIHRNKMLVNSITVSESNISSSNYVRNLGVYLDQEFSMEKHVN